MNVVDELDLLFIKNKLVEDINYFIDIIQNDKSIRNVRDLMCVVQIGELLSKNKKHFKFVKGCSGVIDARNSIVHNFKRFDKNTEKYFNNALSFLMNVSDASDLILEDLVDRDKMTYEEMVKKLRKNNRLYKHLLKLEGSPNVKKFDEEKEYLVFSSSVLNKDYSIEMLKGDVFNILGVVANVRVVKPYAISESKNLVVVLKQDGSKTVCRIEDVYNNSLIRWDEIKKAIDIS